MNRSLCIAVAVLFGAACGAQDRAPSDPDLAGAQVVFLGEIHDNPHHHAAQAEWVARIAPRALVFEMLSPAEAQRVGPDRTDAEALNEATLWEARGWPDFDMYHPIFLAAPGAAIFGSGIPREEARRAVSDGAAAVMGEQAGLFGLDQPLPEAQQEARIAGQDEAHCNALPAELLPGMVEAQRLRDAALARAVIAAMKETGGPVAVITGNGHARNDWGAPALLELAQPGLAVVSIGQFEEEPQDAPHDFWTVSPPPERDDPCEAFR